MPRALILVQNFVGCGVLVAEVGAGGGGRGGRARCSHACLHGVSVHLSGPCVPPEVALRVPHCMRQAPKIAMVCEGGGVAAALAGP